jgi:hypothetical protein
MGGVAAMIGSVVNHSAHLAVAAGGVPAAAKHTKTFGRRNIKNQVLASLVIFSIIVLL